METIIDIGKRISALAAQAREAWLEVEAADRAELIHLCDCVPSALTLGDNDIILRIPHAKDLTEWPIAKVYSQQHVDTLSFILRARTENRKDVIQVGNCVIRDLSEAAMERIRDIVQAGEEWQANAKRQQLADEHERQSAKAAAIETRLTVLQRLVVNMPARTPQELAVKAKALQSCYCHSATLLEASEAILASDGSLAGEITASIIRDMQTFIDQAA